MHVIELSEAIFEIPGIHGVLYQWALGIKI